MADVVVRVILLSYCLHIAHFSCCLHIAHAESLRAALDPGGRDAEPGLIASEKASPHMSHGAARGRPTLSLLSHEGGHQLRTCVFRCCGRRRCLSRSGLLGHVSFHRFSAYAPRGRTYFVRRGAVTSLKRAAFLRSSVLRVRSSASAVLASTQNLKKHSNASSTVSESAAHRQHSRLGAALYPGCTVTSRCPSSSTVSHTLATVLGQRMDPVWRRVRTGSAYFRFNRPQALSSPLMNVVDFASMPSPALSAEEVLRQQELSQGTAAQMRVGALAVKAAAAVENSSGRSPSERARSQSFFPSTVEVARNLQTYRALLFFTSWDTLSQALVAALHDLASLLWMHQEAAAAQRCQEWGSEEDVYDSPGGRPAKACSASHNAERSRKRLSPVPDSTGALAAADRLWSALSKQVAKNIEALKSNESSAVLDTMIPVWLPMTGVRVYNSLVVAQGRRAIDKHKRMLTNKKQLRDHERALLLMVNEGIHYGAGHLPTLQIWRAEEGMLDVGEPEEDALSHSHTVSKETGSRTRPGGVQFTKIFDARGCGPIKLMELAGGDPEPWRVEETLLLKRALLDSKRRPTETETAPAGILSGGHGDWPGLSGLSESDRDYLRVWIAQLSTLYQLHAVPLLLKRLAYAERLFPEFDEFNLRRNKCTRATLKGLLRDLGK